MHREINMRWPNGWAIYTPVFLSSMASYTQPLFITWCLHILNETGACTPLHPCRFLTRTMWMETWRGLPHKRKLPSILWYIFSLSFQHNIVEPDSQLLQWTAVFQRWSDDSHWAMVWSLWGHGSHLDSRCRNEYDVHTNRNVSVIKGLNFNGAQCKMLLDFLSLSSLSTCISFFALTLPAKLPW